MPDFFPRTALADRIGSRLLDSRPTSTSGSGVFLAAPRRTGKSTFLREDLRPQLERERARVIYVDLWEDRESDPGELIVAAIRRELAGRQGALVRLADSLGVESVTAGGVKLSLDQVGLGSGITLTQALAALSAETRQAIVLIIDEAQHAITSDAGVAALFALKAARDELNSSEHHGLIIVATGSNRDKLAMLRDNKDQAFFGAPLVSFPPLDRDYIEWFLERLPFGHELDIDRVVALFERAGHRPEILGSAADTLLFDLSDEPIDLGDRFESLVEQAIVAANDETIRTLRSLTPLQRAVLEELADKAESFAPFEAETLTNYAYRMAAHGAGDAPSPSNSNVQRALEALQKRRLVWRATRGVYALEDAAIATLLRTVQD